MELEDITSSGVTLMLLEETVDEDVIVVLVSDAVLRVEIAFSICEGEVSMISAAERDEDTSSEVTPGSDKLLELRMVEENEAVETDERGELITVMTIGVDASVVVAIVGVTVPSVETGSAVEGASVAV